MDSAAAVPFADVAVQALWVNEAPGALPADEVLGLLLGRATPAAAVLGQEGLQGGQRRGHAGGLGRLSLRCFLVPLPGGAPAPLGLSLGKP